MKKIKDLDFILLISALALIYYLLIRWSGSHTICLIRTFTGLPCPGCGLTHAGMALLRGEILQSLRYHALFILTPFIALLLLLHGRHPALEALYQNRKLWLCVLFLFLGLYCVRLIAFFPDGEYPMQFLFQNSVAGKCYALIFH